MATSPEAPAKAPVAPAADALAGRMPAEAYGAALAGLPEMGPARLSALAGAWPLPEAWLRVVAGTAGRHPLVSAACGGQADTLASRWSRAAVGVDVAEVWRAHQRAGISVAVVGSPDYPDALLSDPERPAVVFVRGDPESLDGPRVAIVGTRRCTRYGVDVAHDLGHDLAASGVRVVSGLALGIDAAAHVGALAAADAPPVAVVGSGLDVIYPRAHASLWRRVERDGVVLSEGPLGTRPAPWRFPARNRVIAALADVLVVVESHHRGGSMLTVHEAARRDRPVMAVPGPVRSPASAGCNDLIADGCGPVRDALDVLVQLGLSPGGRRRADRRPPPEPDDRQVLDALGWQPATVDQLAVRTGLALGPLSVSLTRLEQGGWVVARGGWYERLARTQP